jgi:hypothetical protein
MRNVVVTDLPRASAEAEAQLRLDGHFLQQRLPEYGIDPVLCAAYVGEHGR